MEPKRLGKSEGEANTTGWMTTYSDMMTLLFAFFVLLFAISNVDTKKYAMISAAFSNQLTPELFEQISSGNYSKDGSPVDFGLYPDGDGDGDGTPGVSATPKPSPSPSPGGEGEVEESRYVSYFNDIYKSVEEYIKENDLSKDIMVERHPNRVSLTLENDIWFASGSAEISDTMVEYARILARLLEEKHNDEFPIEIIVEGHTDSMPINTARYPSNWELSVDRAVAFMGVLLSESHLSPSQFSARGYGEKAPVANNGTAEGRQQNRRVEILILEADPNREGLNQ